MIKYPFKPGDIIGFSGDTWTSAAINLATYGIPFWGLSHVGIIANVFAEDQYPNGAVLDWHDESYRGPLCARVDERYDKLGPVTQLLFESTIENRNCAIHGDNANGTQAHFPSAAIERYKGKVWHYPLRRTLRPVESVRFTSFLIKHCGTAYDKVGAARSAGIGLSWVESLLRGEDLSSLFCSEYCAAALKHIGYDLGSASRWNPNRLVRTLRHRGILLEPRRLK